MEVVLFGPVMRRLKREEVSLLLAMGTAVLLEGLAFLVFGEKQRGVPPLATGVYQFGGAFLPVGRAVVLGLAAALIVAVLVYVNYTRGGRALRAMAQDRVATALQGSQPALGRGARVRAWRRPRGARRRPPRDDPRHLLRRRNGDIDQGVPDGHDRRRGQHFRSHSRRISCSASPNRWGTSSSPAR